MTAEANPTPSDREPILQFFGRVDHQPAHIQPVSKKFIEMANILVETAPRNPERTVALRKLLEAKEAMVRAFLYQG